MALVALAVCAGVLAAAAGWGGAMPFEHAVVHIDGDELTLGSLSVLDSALALGGVLLGAGVAVVVALIAVPVAVPLRFCVLAAVGAV